tara:strand:- start:551 stop:757 length:207 start_codon:yes stop_codon:yes gene_type:complete
MKTSFCAGLGNTLTSICPFLKILIALAIRHTSIKIEFRFLNTQCIGIAVFQFSTDWFWAIEKLRKRNK